MQTYILIDLNNLLHRAKHVTHGDTSLKIGLSMHIAFTSILSMWRKFEADHVVICLDGKSWRREVYESYKRSRRVAAEAKSLKEQKEDEEYNEAFWDMINFFQERTNVSVLQSAGLEADDLIARWIAVHPDCKHVIISSDSDFFQLLSSNVEIYNGITNYRITATGVYDDKDKPREFSVKNDGKIKVGKADPNFVPEPEWWEWAKFSKIMRGDAGDGIMTAYPKVRQTQLRKAYEDRKERGFIWNNLMLQTWQDHEGNTRRVLDCYNENRMLIDLCDLPEEICILADSVIQESVTRSKRPQIGIWFLRFCNKYELVRLEQNPNPHLEYLQAEYKD